MKESMLQVLIRVEKDILAASAEMKYELNRTGGIQKSARNVLAVLT